MGSARQAVGQRRAPHPGRLDRLRKIECGSLPCVGPAQGWSIYLSALHLARCPSGIDTYRELTKLIDPADVAIWTGAHDAPSTLEEIRSRFDGFEPTAPRFKKVDVEGFRVAIISHNWYLSTKGIHGALSYEGHPRTLHLIDERLSEVKLSDLGLADVIKARDTIISQRGDKDPLACALTALAVYIDHVWETERVIPGAAFKAIGGVQPTPSNDRLEWFTSDDAATEARRAFSDKTVADAIAFGRSLVTGHAFMARYQQATKGGRFISYKLDLPPYRWLSPPRRIVRHRRGEGFDALARHVSRPRSPSRTSRSSTSRSQS